MTPHEQAAKEAGGTCITVPLPSREEWDATLKKYAPGCGTPTEVVGTNGGTMPCGAMLNVSGKPEQYFCAACAADQH